MRVAVGPRNEHSFDGFGLDFSLQPLNTIETTVANYRDDFQAVTFPTGWQYQTNTNGAIGTMSGASSHLGGANNRHAVEVRVVGSKGMFHLDLRENLLWRYRSPEDDVRVPLADDAGLYDCVGPIDALVAAGAGRPFDNNSPAELGARTVEILEAAYRSASRNR